MGQSQVARQLIGEDDALPYESKKEAHDDVLQVILVFFCFLFLPRTGFRKKLRRIWGFGDWRY